MSYGRIKKPIRVYQRKNTRDTPILRLFDESAMEYINYEDVARMTLTGENFPEFNIHSSVTSNKAETLLRVYLNMLHELEAWIDHSEIRKKDTKFLNRIIANGGFTAYIKKLAEIMELQKKEYTTNQKNISCVGCRETFGPGIKMLTFTYKNSENGHYLRKKVCAKCERYFARKDPLSI